MASPDLPRSSSSARGTATGQARARTLWRWGIGAAVAAAALVAGLRLWSPQRVSTVTVAEREIVQILAVVGRVRAPSRAALGAAVAGTISEVRVR